MRSYTPISPTHHTDVFEFVIKLYENGRMSRYLKKFKVGDKLKIKTTVCKYHRPNGITHIGMIAAGTGMTDCGYL
jgi:cytochrome-b5 reductase